jgi:PAS domain S-box-containing protein
MPPLRLLLLDAPSNDAERVAAALRQAGYPAEIIRAATEAEFLVGLEAAPDLILAATAHAPGALKALELLAGRYATVPLIVLSDGLSDEEAVACLHRGAVDYVRRDRLERLGDAVDRARALAERDRIERTLRENEERYRAVVEQTIEGIYLFDPDTRRLIEANDAFLQLLGYAPEDVAQLTLYDLVAADRDSIDANVQRVTEQRRYLVGERPYRRKDGAVIEVEVKANLVTYLGRQIICVFVRDVTERKHWERELQRRNAEAATLNEIGHALSRLASTDEIVHLIQTTLAQVLGDHDVYIALYDEAAKTISFPVYFIQGQPISPAPRPLSNGITDYVIRTRAPLLIPHHVPETLAHLGIEAYGQMCASYLGVPMLASGKVIGVLATQDYERAYAHTLGQLELFSTIAAQAAIAIENARLYTAAQQQLAERIGAEAELAALYSASAQLLNPGETPQAVAEQIVRVVTHEFEFADCGVMLVDEAAGELRRLARAGKFQVTASAPLRLNGSGLTVTAVHTGQSAYAPDVLNDPRYIANFDRTRSEIAVPLHAGGRVIGVLDLQSAELDAFDERARRIIIAFAERAAPALAHALLVERLDQARHAAEEASQLKSEFLANTSHELRTPLTAILGALNLYLNHLYDTAEEAQGYVQLAHDSAKTLLNIVNDLLDIARIEAGKVTVTPQAVDIANLLAEVYMLMWVQAEAKGIHLDAQLPAQPLLAWADPEKTKQILINLVGNAIKFTERGSVSLRVTAGADQRVSILVQDTGIGIAPDKQGRLFQPFVQADGTTTRRYGGTGLGLSISRRLAEMMAGTLTLYSAGEGQGSTFTFTLPLTDAAA